MAVVETTYTYLITDFLNDQVDASLLDEEIRAVISDLLLGVSVFETTCDIVFSDALTPAQVILLDAVVAAHTGFPPTFPGIRKIASGLVDFGTPVETAYVISSGKSLKITSFSGGAASSVSGGKIGLFHRPTGLPASDVMIDQAYSNGNDFNRVPDGTYAGNGTAKIVMIRTNMGGAQLDMTAKWVGEES
jgi:hypothetical protein